MPGGSGGFQLEVTNLNLNVLLVLVLCHGLRAEAQAQRLLSSATSGPARRPGHPRRRRVGPDGLELRLQVDSEVTSLELARLQA
jgi:hypothetical protein